MTLYYPPWAFYYKVEFGSSSQPNEANFQSASGLSVEYDTEEYKEGGENRFTHKLPIRTKYADLVLKRGMLTGSDTVQWFLDAFRERIFMPKPVSVILMNEKGEPLRTWNVVHAVPKKWTVSDFNASESAVVVETLELTYQYFTVA
ncbi:phage tail protein [Cellulomonas sp. URHE0023]|uniref:phage tail protein n=1 Tax=Cellulomonas sp. URHE0023 TaxID=1380354 RepID=UPI000489DC00|nr:phage tail protein [Cellulomonas sp. URHE0023]